jgi:hypothetical protein
MKNDLKKLPFKPDKYFIVDNYLEAVGVMNSIKAGIAVESVRRPLKHTKIQEVNGDISGHNNPAKILINVANKSEK